VKGRGKPWRHESLIAWKSLRFRQWWYYALLPGAAALFMELPADLWRLPLAVLCAACCLAWAFGLNAVTDRRGDRDRRKNPLAGQIKVSPGPMLASGGAAILAMVTALPLGSLSLGAAGISLAAGALYSAGPRLKSMPWLGLLGNVLIFMPLLLLGLYAGHVAPALWVFVLCFAVLLTQNQLIHELGDRDEDLVNQDRTTGALLGADGTSKMVFGLGFAGAFMLLMGSMSTPAVWWASAGMVAAALPVWMTEASNAAKMRVRHRYLSAVVGGGLFALTLVERMGRG